MKNLAFLTSFMPLQPGEVGDTIIHGRILKALHTVQLGHWDEGPAGHGVMQGLPGEDRGGGRGCWGVEGLFAARRKVFQFCNI